MVCPSLEHCLVILTSLVKAYKQMTDGPTNTPNIDLLKIFLINILSWGDLEFGNFNLEKRDKIALKLSTGALIWKEDILVEIKI